MRKVYFHLPVSLYIILYVGKNETGLLIRLFESDETAEFGFRPNKLRKNPVLVTGALVFL